MTKQEYYLNDFHRKRSKSALMAIIASKACPLSLEEMIAQARRLTPSKSKLLQWKSLEEINGC